MKQINKRDLLKRGGLIIHPILADGSRVEVVIDFSLGSKALVQEAFYEMEAEDIMIKDATIFGMLGRASTQGISNSPHDLIAILRGMSKGTKDELTLDQCKWATVNALDAQKVQYALAMSMSQREDYTQEEWESIQDAPTIEKAEANFLLLLGR